MHIKFASGRSSQDYCSVRSNSRVMVRQGEAKESERKWASVHYYLNRPLSLSTPTVIKYRILFRTAHTECTVTHKWMALSKSAGGDSGPRGLKLTHIHIRCSWFCCLSTHKHAQEKNDHSKWWGARYHHKYGVQCARKRGVDGKAVYAQGTKTS